MNKTKIATAIFAIFLISLATSYYVYASYTMQSNHLSNTSSNQALIGLTQNATTSIVNIDTIRLTGTEPTLTSTVVSFYDGTTLIGTATSSAGSVIFDYPIVTAKTFDFHATATHP